MPILPDLVNAVLIYLKKRTYVIFLRLKKKLGLRKFYLRYEVYYTACSNYRKIYIIFFSEGYITEISKNGNNGHKERKLRQVVLSADLIMCLKPNFKKEDPVQRWHIPLNHINVDMSEIKEEITMKYKTEINTLDGKIVELTSKINALGKLITETITI